MTGNTPKIHAMGVRSRLNNGFLLFRLRRGPVLLTCALMAVSACSSHQEHPLLGPATDARLRSAAPLDVPAFVRRPPVELKDTPEEAPLDLFNQARGVVERSAPESLELDLTSLRQQVLANNLDLKVDLIAPSIAQQSVNEEEARFEAVFSATVAENEQRGAFATPPQAWARSLNLVPSIKVPLRTGGTFTASIPYTGTDIEQVGDTQMPGLNLSITQPLLRAAGVEFSETTIRIAQFQRRVADAQTKLTAIGVLAEAEQTYWKYYVAYRNLETALQQYKMAEEQVAIAESLVQGGVLTKVDVTRARAGLPPRLEAIIVGETTRRQIQRDLKRIMNRPDLPLQSVTTIFPKTAPRPVRLDLDAGKLAELAVKNRVDLVLNNIQAAIDDVMVALQRNLSLPSLALQATWSGVGTKSHLSSALHQVFDRELNSWTIALAVEVPLGNRAAKARLSKALLQRLRTRATTDQITLAIRQDVFDAVDVVEQNWQRILTARRGTLLAAQTYAAEKIEFQQAHVTSTEVLAAAATVGAAQSQEISALGDYQNSLVGLARATGTVLGMSRVQWSPTPLNGR